MNRYEPIFNDDGKIIGGKKMDNMELILGELIGTVKQVNSKLDDMSCDIKILVTDNATTKERLLNGNKRFENHEDRIVIVEGKHFPWGKIGTIIGLGFTLLGLLIMWRPVIIK